MKKQIAVIGLEMHCELISNSKVFSSAKNEYNETPNSNIVPLDLALPGTLPVVNKKCVGDALKMSMILNCKMPEYMYFDRKNYYYPDLPKGYQITQMTEPVGIDGEIEIEVDEKLIPVRIHDIHLEEDTANLDHYFDTTTIDYNRAGVPLLELVTEPAFHSASEAVAFIEHIINIYRYTGISDADTKRGQVRCDVNVSIMDEDATEFGTKVEVKGVNSISGVFDTINYEIKRQTELKSQGKYNEVEQETRRWDEEKQITIRMRSKVDAIDYKYFVEPNIPKFKIDANWIEDLKKSIPRLHLERKYDYINNYGLSNYDAGVLVKDINIYEISKVYDVNYKEELKLRYKLTDEDFNSIINKREVTLEIMNIIARKRGAIVSGGEIDYEKVAVMILNDFRTAKIGRITLEKVNEG